MRGATMRPPSGSHPARVSIHAPHAGRDRLRLVDKDVAVVSIHAPHAGRDIDDKHLVFALVVSIHAPHAGRDGDARAQPRRPRRFNPRAPCGARHTELKSILGYYTFQSTRPMRGATLTIMFQSLH